MSVWLTQKLRQRVLVYPALLLVAVPISYGIAVFHLSGIRSHSAWFFERSRIGVTATQNLEILFIHEPNLMEQLSAGDHLLSEMPKAFRESFVGDPWDDDGTDVWGNPIHILVRDEPTGRWFGVYSMGQDGISGTSGNDPDDINTWGQDGSAYYQPRGKRAWKLKRALRTLFNLCFAFPVVVCIYEFARSYLRYPDGMCQACGYDLSHTPDNICPECGHAT